MTQPRRSQSMTLLNDLMAKSMDNSYELAVERRSVSNSSRSQRSWVSTTLVVLLSGIVGLIIVWGTSHLRVTGESGPDARNALYLQLEDRRDVQETLLKEREALQSEILSLQEADVSLVGQELLRRSAELSIWNGTTAVQGSGITIEMTDSPSVDPLSTGFDENRVQDYDLQVVVNALRASGAEAIAINGNRLTGTTAIRSAGAILVDLQPIISPYVITAIGDPQELRRNFANGPGAQQLSVLLLNHNIKHTIETSDSLEVPAGRATSRFVEATNG